MTLKLTKGGASRVTRMLKWLQQQANPLVVELVLELDGNREGEADRIAAWARDKSFNPQAVANEIEDMVTAIASEVESKQTGRLVWLTDTGARWTTFPIQVEPEGGAPQAFDGTSKGLLVQQQRHMEGIALTYFKATDAVLRTYGSTLDSLTKLIETRENRAADLEAEVARLRDENAQLQTAHAEAASIAEQAVQGAESAAEELSQRREASSTDGQMLKLLSKVAGDIATGSAKGS